VSRFLLATWDGGGTIPPELGLAAELVARGHEVVVLSDDTVEAEALSAGATFTCWRRAPQARARDFDRALIRDWEVKNPLAQIRQVGDLLFFGPAALHAADLAEAIDEFAPDALIVDALLTGASAGAERSGLPTGRARESTRRSSLSVHTRSRQTLPSTTAPAPTRVKVTLRHRAPSPGVRPATPIATPFATSPAWPA